MGLTKVTGQLPVSGNEEHDEHHTFVMPSASLATGLLDEQSVADVKAFWLDMQRGASFEVKRFAALVQGDADSRAHAAAPEMTSRFLNGSMTGTDWAQTIIAGSLSLIGLDRATQVFSAPAFQHALTVASVGFATTAYAYATIQKEGGDRSATEIAMRVATLSAGIYITRKNLAIARSSYIPRAPAGAATAQQLAKLSAWMNKVEGKFASGMKGLVGQLTENTEAAKVFTRAFPAGELKSKLARGAEKTIADITCDIITQAQGYAAKVLNRLRAAGSDPKLIDMAHDLVDDLAGMSDSPRGDPLKRIGQFHREVTQYLSSKTPST